MLRSQPGALIRRTSRVCVDGSIRVVFLLAALYLLSANYVVWMRALLSLCLDEWFQCPLCAASVGFVCGFVQSCNC